MKRTTATLAILLALVAFTAFSQDAMPKTYNGVYSAFTFHAATKAKADSTGFHSSSILQPQHDIKQVVIYVRVDTLASSDTMKCWIQGSPNNVDWYNLDSTTVFNARSQQRKVVSVPDLYLKLYTWVKTRIVWSGLAGAR